MKIVKKFAPIIASVLGLVAIVMIFCTAMVNAEDANEVYAGWQVVFGYSLATKVGNSTTYTPIFAFSFMNLVPYILVLGGIALSVLLFLGKGNKILFWVAVALFAVAAVFFFLTWVGAIREPSMLGDYVVKSGEELKQALTIGFGPIVAGICSILAAAAASAPFFIEKFVE
ncbi:MAG: hypothetical protein IKC37_01210 [Clostridia bacterium]|nr:hypothetical protein [Clostridia bacterium]